MLFSLRRFQTASFLVVWLMTALVWTPMAMLGHVSSSQAATHGSVVAGSEPVQQETAMQEDCSGVDCNGMIHHMSSCDLACQPMVRPKNYENRKIRNINSFLLFDSGVFLAFSPETIERPPRHSA